MNGCARLLLRLNVLYNPFPERDNDPEIENELVS